MALTGSGQISYQDINVELGNGSSAEQDMDTMTGEAIVSFTTIVNEPDDITDWYSYSHVVPSAPSNVVTNLNSDIPDVKVTWDDNSSTEEGFKIYQSKNRGVYVLKDTVGVGVTSTIISETCTVDDTYQHRVSSFNVVGESGQIFGDEKTRTTCVPP